MDAPIQRYLPEFPAKPGAPITARLLAAHLAGIRHTRAGERTAEFLARHYTSPRETVGLFANDTLVAPAGTRYSYTSYGYNLLAAVMEAAAGERFQDLVRREVIAPLGLTATDFDNVRLVLPGRVRRYAYNDPYTYAVTDTLLRMPEFDYSFNAGGGNIRSTVVDLAQFGLAVFRDGYLSDSMRTVMRTRVRVGEVQSPWSSGWFVGNGEPTPFYITGSNPGFQGGLWVYPDRDIAVALLANAWGRGAVSGDMVIGLPQRVAALCGGWAVE
jgi:CubicO group peptidase (beta-lactamase class C family)